MPISSSTAADTVVLRHAESEPDLRACFAVMQELRPHLQDEDEFLARVSRQAMQHYRLLAAWQDDAVVALAGYRWQENLVYGKFLYVDDLVTTASARGGSYGARLLDALSTLAQQQQCARLVLDTGMANALAQRFYFRQGLLTSSLRFGKPIALSTQ